MIRHHGRIACSSFDLSLVRLSVTILMFKINRKSCTGCRICEMICSFAHEGEIAPKRSRIRIESDWPGMEGIDVCVACRAKKCIAVCPHGALSWGRLLLLDQEKCDLCLACVEACPFGGIRLEPTNKRLLFCDTCRGEYQCVKWCPANAIVRAEGNGR